jgi:hypothetical protein
MPVNMTIAKISVMRPPSGMRRGISGVAVQLERAGPYPIRSITAMPNSLHLSSFASCIKRWKSYVTVFAGIAFDLHLPAYGARKPEARA